MGQDAGGPSTDNTATAKEGDEEYRVYAARWLALAGLMLLMISSSSAWNTFSPVAARAAEFYGVGIQTVNWFALDMYLAFVVTGLLSAHIIDSLGLRVALITGASLTCAGLWLRYLGTLSSNRHTALAIAFAGQTLCGLGRPLGTASTTRLASTWFGIRERTYANAVASVSPSAGVLVASAVSPFLVATPDDIPRALLTWACISVFPLFVAVFVPGAPPTPPSPSAAVLVATRTQSLAKFKTSLHTAVTNPSFILLWVIMSLQLTIFFIYVVLISSIMSGAGYSPQQAGFVTVAIISAGWFSTPISKIVDRTGGWIPAMRSLLVLTTVAFAGLTLSVRYNVYWAIILCGAGFGFVSTPVLPVVFELAMESTYPHLLPAMSQYLFYAIGCLLAVILVPILGGVQNKEIVLWVLVGVSAFTALVGMLYRGKTKRRMHETLVLEGKKKEGEAESVGSVESDAKQGGGPEAADPKV